MNQRYITLRSRVVMLIAAVAFLDGGASVAWGQLFGERTTGQPLQSQRARTQRGQTPTPPRAQTPTNPAASDLETDAVGTLQGDERFLRENRNRDAFVGSDRRSTNGFIGSQQALGSGRVRQAVEDLPDTTDDASRINQPLPPLPDGAMQYPRLELGDDFPSLTASDGAADDATEGSSPVPDTELQQRLEKHVNGSIQILRQGDLAILQGTVESRDEAERLKLLVSFEPRIYRIEDRLELAGATSPLPSP